jgi:hypothetical protein
MAIQAGQNGRVTDFVFQAEAGEDISQNDSLFLAKGTEKKLIGYNEGDTDIATSTTVRLGQTFTVPNGCKSLVKVQYTTKLNQGDDYYYEIRRNSFTGTLIASGDTGQGSGQASFPKSFNINNVVVVEGETLYLIVYTSGATIRGNSANLFGGGQAFKSVNSGASFSVSTEIEDITFQVLFNFGEKGKLFKTYSQKYQTSRTTFETFETRNIAFAMESKTKGLQLFANPQLIINTFTGLSAGDDYYIQFIEGNDYNNLGGLLVTVQEKDALRVGIAVNGTSIVKALEQ